jgi:hypothetical protein
MRTKIFFILFFSALILSESVEIQPADATIVENTNEIMIERFLQYLRIKTTQPDADYSKAVDFLKIQAERIGLEFNVKEV